MGEKENLWKKIIEQSKQTETQIPALERKRTGSYYTSFELTSVMVKDLFSEIKKSKRNIEDLLFLEPCVGSGNFVFTYLNEIEKLNLSAEQNKNILQNIYVCDINKNALQTYKKNLSDFARTFFRIELGEEYFSSHIAKGLLVDLSAPTLEYIPIEKRFPQIKNKFDIIVTNPPYKNLKAEQTQYDSKKEFEEDKEKYTDIFNIIKPHFQYSLDGVLNLYKLFVEAIVDQYANENAFISLLVPQTILSDKTSEKLRTHLLTENEFFSVKVIAENSGFIDAQQSLATLLLKKGSTTKSIRVTKDFCKNPNQETKIAIQDILNKNTGNAIFAITDSEYNTLKNLRKFPTVKDLPFISNLRGELDLTINKNSILEKPTNYKLLRGRNIGTYFISDSVEYIADDFVEKTNKKKFIENERIICQQIVNINKEKRVQFAYIPKGYVLGNSCNFISISENEFNLDIFALLGLFNCSIINWYFKLTSSNNHINNYEIDTFPIPVNSPHLEKISGLVREYLSTKNEKLLEQIENYAFLSYQTEFQTKGVKMKTQKSEFVKKFLADIRHLIPSLDEHTANEILNENLEINSYVIQVGLNLTQMQKDVIFGITDKYIKLSKNEVLNHTTFKLSDLDLEMVRSVPQGGSWKNIPKETVEKSKRLVRITETGGRTTLYGRIDYSKPSYTITTYFNRPGNGTYIHPIHDRVLSVREAARFQCFKDDYYFFGNKTQLLKQVGNAVPTLMAYQIARTIIEKTGLKKSLDLFCGAGGLTAGFKEAGIKSVIANDIEQAACTTLKINNPEIELLCGDVTKKEVKDKLIETAINNGAEIICGGPPCQGFSMAGLRDENDPRNQLFRDFVEIVSKIKPKIIVFENVEGLLSYQGGKVYNDIISLFIELGYIAEGRTIMTNEYAVPQKRKRVIIICTRSDLKIYPSELFPKAITTNAKYQISAKYTIADLENVPCSEKTKYIETEESDIVKLFKGKMTYPEFLEKHTEPKSEINFDGMDLFSAVEDAIPKAINF